MGQGLRERGATSFDMASGLQNEVPTSIKMASGLLERGATSFETASSLLGPGPIRFPVFPSMTSESLGKRGWYNLRMKLPVVLTPDEEGFIVAECPVIPGCISQGRSREEALANIREAIELCLEARADEEDPWELPASYEIVDLQGA